MATSGVEMRIFGSAAEAERAIVRLEKKYDDLENKIKQTSRSSKRGTDEGATGLQNMGRAADEMFSRLAAGVGILQGLRNEFNNFREAQERSRQTQLSFAAAFDQALLNAGSLNADQLQQMIERVAQNSGVDPTRVANALSTALSARGNLSINDTEQVVTQSLKLSRNLPELTPQLTGAALDLQKRFGAQGADAEDALGFLLSIGSEARVTNTAALAQSVGPGVLGVSREGASARSAGALLAAFTQATGDESGRGSSTAAISFARQLKEALPDEATFQDRLNKLQQDPAFRREFLGGLSLERKFIGAAESLASGGDVAGLFGKAFENLPEIADAQDTFRSKLEQLGQGPVAGTADLDTTLNSLIQQGQINDTEGGQTATLRARVRELQQNAGLSATTSTVTGAIADLATSLGADPVRAQQVSLLQQAASPVNILSGRSPEALKIVQTLESIERNTGERRVNREAQTE